MHCNSKDLFDIFVKISQDNQLNSIEEKLEETYQVEEAFANIDFNYQILAELESVI